MYPKLLKMIVWVLGLFDPVFYQFENTFIICKHLIDSDDYPAILTTYFN